MAERNCKVVTSSIGGPEQLKTVDCPTPIPAANEVLIQNEAVGVAFADVLIRGDVYPGIALPVTPGHDVVGIVVSKGKDVETVQVGWSVAALTETGGYAKYANVAAATVVRVPETLSSAVAASLVLNGLTAYQMLTRCVSLNLIKTILYGDLQVESTRSCSTLRATIISKGTELHQELD